MKQILIGQIVNTHGLKGELRIVSNFPYKELVFKPGFKVYVGKRNDLCIINSYRKHKIYDMVTFEGIDDIDSAIAYKGDYVYIDRLDLEIDGYLNEDIIGFDVYNIDEENTELESVGILKDVVNNGAQDILVINSKDDEKIMVPFVDEYVKKVDLDNKKIVIQAIEGLLNEN